MRRFESADCVRLRTQAGTTVASWAARTVSLRLLGLALVPGPGPANALLIPRCRSIHTLGMRFSLDVAFLAWPPAPESEVLVVRAGVRPGRIVVARGRAGADTAALELRSPFLIAHGIRPGMRLSVDSWPDVSEPAARVNAGV